MEDGEEIVLGAFIDEHPANYDQQVEVAKELIPKAKAFILCAAIPNDDDGVQEMHVIVGRSPGISTGNFVLDAINAIAKTGLYAVSQENEYYEETQNAGEEEGTSPGV